MHRARHGRPGLGRIRFRPRSTPGLGTQSWLRQALSPIYVWSNAFTPAGYSPTARGQRRRVVDPGQPRILLIGRRVVQRIGLFDGCRIRHTECPSGVLHGGCRVTGQATSAHSMCAALRIRGALTAHAVPLPASARCERSPSGCSPSGDQCESSQVVLCQGPAGGGRVLMTSSTRPRMFLRPRSSSHPTAHGWPSDTSVRSRARELPQWQLPRFSSASTRFPYPVQILVNFQRHRPIRHSCAA